MKKIYTKNTIIRAYLINDVEVEITLANRLPYCYGDLPSDTQEKYNNPDTVFIDLCNAMKIVPLTTFFTKKKYIDSSPYGQWRMEQDIFQIDLISFTIDHTYKEVTKPDIEWLKQSLGFYGYSKVIFEREQDLKSMMM